MERRVQPWQLWLFEVAVRILPVLRDSGIVGSSRLGTLDNGGGMFHKTSWEVGFLRVKLFIKTGILC